MKHIQLGGNRFKNRPIRAYAEVDDEDFEHLSNSAWFISTNGYAVRSNWYKNRKGGGEQMSRVIMNCPEDRLVDHIDGNKLNNQKKNLRFATKSTNAANIRMFSHNKSGYKGVHFDSYSNKWRAEINYDNKHIRLGRYIDIKDAVQAYNKAALELFGEFAYLNKV